MMKGKNMHSNNDGMDPSGRPNPISKTELEYNKWYNSFKGTPLTKDAWMAADKLHREAAQGLINAIESKLYSIEKYEPGSLEQSIWKTVLEPYKQKVGGE